MKGSIPIFGDMSSIATMSHSYMSMVVIGMDGTLFPHMYVLVAEPSGHFPASMAAEFPNVKVYANRSTNMTKRDLQIFLEQVSWPDLHGNNRVLFLVHSWAAKKDDDLYNRIVPVRVL